MLKYLPVLFWATAVVAQTNTVSVAQAKQMANDTPVVLWGSVQNKINEDKYLFSDGTDTIIVEIDDDKMIPVVPTDTVEIIGEVEQDKNNIEIEVDSITKK